MNDTYNKNREVFIAEAYKLIEAESTLDDFKKEIRNMQPKFGIIDLAKQPKSKDGMIAMGRFGGDEDLKHIINECLGLLDGNNQDVAKCVKTKNAYKFEAVTSRYHIKVYRDVKEKADALVVRHRF